MFGCYGKYTKMLVMKKMLVMGTITHQLEIITISIIQIFFILNCFLAIYIFLILILGSYSIQIFINILIHYIILSNGIQFYLRNMISNDIIVFHLKIQPLKAPLHLKYLFVFNYFYYFIYVAINISVYFFP